MDFLCLVFERVYWLLESAYATLGVNTSFITYGAGDEVGKRGECGEVLMDRKTTEAS